MNRPKILVFASGERTSGGTGFANLVKYSREGIIDSEIVGVVSNVWNGAVHRLAGELDIRFIHFNTTADAINAPHKYRSIAEESGADFFALSGWKLVVSGLDNRTIFSPSRVFNIHPGPLPRSGKKYGRNIHESVVSDFKRGKLSHTEICMHFVTDKVDEGPVFFRSKIEIRPSDTAELLEERVRGYERMYQPIVTDMVAKKEISWDGVDPHSLVVPPDYDIDFFA